MKLRFAQRALSEIERGKREWLAQREKNPGLFEEELAEVFENIKTVPAGVGLVRSCQRGHRAGASRFRRAR